MRKRRVYVSFPEIHGSDANLLNNQKVLDGLNIRFKVNIYGEAGVSAGTYIDVYNLNRQDLQFLTTSAATWLDKQSLIQLYAGYDDDIHMLFSGAILKSPPVGSPDIDLRIQGLGDVQWLNTNIAIQKSNIKVANLVDYCGSVMGYPVNMPSWLRNSNEWLNRQIDEFSFTGTPMALMRKLQQMCGGFSPDGKNFLLYAYNDEIYTWSPTRPDTGSKLLVSKNTGMIGYPELTGVGVEVKTLLNPNVKCGDVITVQSERVPIANGDYFVMSLTHEGELRGDNWYTTLRCAHASNYRG